jgi:hypothetical protein
MLKPPRGDGFAPHDPALRGRLKLGATGALALAAASTGVIVPSLRALVEHSGGGATAGGVFTAAHVVGGIAGAVLGAQVLRWVGSARRLAALALLTSVVVTLAIAAVDALALRIGLRLLDGGFHMLALTALIAIATAGDPTLRAGRAVWMGVAIVVGVASGLGLGALVGSPNLALIVAAALSAAALILVVAEVRDEPAGEPVAATRSRQRRPIAPGMLAFGERFIFGTLTAATPFLAKPSRVGMVLGVFMTASLVALPIARRYALRWGARPLAVRSTLAFVVALAPCAFVDVFASVGGALPWAVVCGTAAGALYASALVLAARSAVLEERVRDMGTVHAAGSAGHALGALCAGLLVGVLPGTLVIAIPGMVIIAAATFGVWITVPEAARDCPVIGGLARAGDDAASRTQPTQPVT